MKLYIGGACQGQEELARRENPGAELFADFHLTLRKVLESGKDPEAYTRRLIAEHPHAVVVCDEIGCGPVPMERADRVWREAVGGALCLAAAASESVTRVVCGIGVRIK